MTEEQAAPIVYTVSQAARILQVEPITVRRKIAQGKIKAFRLGDGIGPYRIHKEALDAYMQEREQFVEVDNQEEK